MKDRRKDWQKQCINFRWSRCGTICTDRNGQDLAKRQIAFLTSGQTATKITWYEQEDAT